MDIVVHRYAGPTTVRGHFLVPWRFTPAWHIAGDSRHSVTNSRDSRKITILTLSSRSSLPPRCFKQPHPSRVSFVYLASYRWEMYSVYCSSAASSGKTGRVTSLCVADLRHVRRAMCVYILALWLFARFTIVLRVVRGLPRREQNVLGDVRDIKD